MGPDGTSRVMNIYLFSLKDNIQKPTVASTYHPKISAYLKQYNLYQYIVNTDRYYLPKVITYHL